MAAFIEYLIAFGPGIYIYNYVDKPVLKPDFDMNTLVKTVYQILGRDDKVPIRIPYLGLAIGKLFDFVASATHKKFAISSIRVKKFCSNSHFGIFVSKTGFKPPVSLIEGLQRTIRSEFIEKHQGPIFHTEYLTPTPPPPRKCPPRR